MTDDPLPQGDGVGVELFPVVEVSYLTVVTQGLRNKTKLIRSMIGIQMYRDLTFFCDTSESYSNLVLKENDLL